MVFVVPAAQKRRKRIVKGERRGNAACFKSLNIRDGFSFLFHKKFRKGCTYFATQVINLIRLAGIQFSDDNITKAGILRRKKLALQAPFNDHELI